MHHSVLHVRWIKTIWNVPFYPLAQGIIRAQANNVKIARAKGIWEMCVNQSIRIKCQHTAAFGPVGTFRSLSILRTEAMTGLCVTLCN